MPNFFTDHLDTIGAALTSLIFYFIIGAMAWQKINDRVDEHEDRIKILEDGKSTTNQLLGEINEKFGRLETLVQTTFTFIQKQIESLFKKRR